MEINLNQCKDISYSKEKGKKTIDYTKKKNTGLEFKNSDVPTTTCSLIKQQYKSYRGSAEIDADNVEKSEFPKHILSKSGNKTNVKFYPSATTKDITDYLRLAIRKDLTRLSNIQVPLT